MSTKIDMWSTSKWEWRNRDTVGGGSMQNLLHRVREGRKGFRFQAALRFVYLLGPMKSFADKEISTYL